MASLPDDVLRWLDAAGSVELLVEDHEHQALRTMVGAEYDGDDLLMPVAEGGPIHHALIYDPQATVLVRDPANGDRMAEIHGEVEMTTAGAADLHVRTGGEAGLESVWLVVRVVPTVVDMHG